MLVAIAIPVFTTQLYKSQLATDTANVRSAYAEGVAEALANATDDVTSITANYTCKYCTVAFTAGSGGSEGKIEVTHKKKTDLKNTIAVDGDITSITGLTSAS